MKHIKILFVDFWPSFNIKENFITKIISSKYSYEIVRKDESPDFLFYSCFGNEHYSYDCIKIYYTGENDVPNFNECDYAISFHYLDFGERYIRLPLYVFYEDSFNALRNNNILYSDNLFERDFCSIVVSNSIGADPFRQTFFHELSNYKFIASGGRFANNIGGPVKDKLKFITKYKFNIAIENSSVEGYTTEKIIEPLSAATIPIYWGNKLIEKEINPEAFINLHNFTSIDSAISYIKKIDSNKNLYLQMLFADKLLTNKYVYWEEMLITFLSNIFENKHRYITHYGLIGRLNKESVIKNKLYSFPKLRNNISTLDKISKVLHKLKI